MAMLGVLVLHKEVMLYRSHRLVMKYMGLTLHLCRRSLTFCRGSICTKYTDTEVCSAGAPKSQVSSIHSPARSTQVGSGRHLQQQHAQAVQARPGQLEACSCRPEGHGGPALCQDALDRQVPPDFRCVVKHNGLQGPWQDVRWLLGSGKRPHRCWFQKALGLQPGLTRCRVRLVMAFGQPHGPAKTGGSKGAAGHSSLHAFWLQTCCWGLAPCLSATSGLCQHSVLSPTLPPPAPPHRHQPSTARRPAGPLDPALMLAGVGATLARDVPFSAIYWGSLEPIRRSLLPSDQGATAGQVLAANCCAGGLGGAAAAAITTPLVLPFQQLQAGQVHFLLAATLACMSC